MPLVGLVPATVVPGAGSTLGNPEKRKRVSFLGICPWVLNCFLALYFSKCIPSPCQQLYFEIRGSITGELFMLQCMRLVVTVVACYDS